MKKTILLTLVVAMVALLGFTGCQKEQAYSLYQIGPEFIGLPTPKDENEFNNLPPEQKDLYNVANYMAGWLIENGFVLTAQLNNPIVIYGEIEATNDASAKVMYNNKVVELDRVDWTKVLTDAQTEKNSNGQPKLTIATSGSVSFVYAMTKGSAASIMKDCRKGYTVDYQPLAQ